MDQVIIRGRDFNYEQFMTNLENNYKSKVTNVLQIGYCTALSGQTTVHVFMLSLTHSITFAFV